MRTFFLSFLLLISFRENAVPKNGDLVFGTRKKQEYKLNSEAKIYNESRLEFATCTGQHAIIKYHLPEIQYIKLNAPVTFSKIDFDRPGTKPTPALEKKIHEILIDYYLSAGGDDSETYFEVKTLYFNTICIPFNKMQLFIVILKFPSGEINTKLFLYDPLHDNCGNAIDYNIFAMYQKEGNRLLKSNLRHLLRVKKDIQLKGSPGNQLLQLARLYHNGTANAAEIINYQQKGMELDTSSIQFNWIWIR